MKNKMKHLNKQRLIFPMLVLCLVIESCDAQVLRSTKKALPVNKEIIEVWKDSSVVEIMTSPTKVNFYTLKALTEPDSTSKLLGKYVIDKQLGTIDKVFTTMVQFFVLDTTYYDHDTTIIEKCPFAPYLAFEFLRGNEKVTLFMAFNCNQWAVLFRGKQVEASYTCRRELLRIAHWLLPDDKYINIVMNQK